MGKFVVFEMDENYVLQSRFTVSGNPAAGIKYQDAQVPAIIPIPSVKGATGFGVKIAKRYVEQAVGADIAFDDNE